MGKEVRKAQSNGCTPDNPPRKIPRRCSAITSAPATTGPLSRKRGRSKTPYRRKRQSKLETGEDSKMSEFIDPADIVIPWNERPIQELCDRVTGLIKQGVITKGIKTGMQEALEVQESTNSQAVMGLQESPERDAIQEPTLNTTSPIPFLDSGISGVDAECLDEGHFSLKHMDPVVQSDSFLEEEAVTLQSRLFCNPPILEEIHDTHDDESCSFPSSLEPIDCLATEESNLC